LFDVGLRSHYVAAQHAVRLMVGQQQGLIVNVSSAGAQSKFAVLPYGVAKAALDRMSMDMAEELRDSGITVVSLWPPPTATEAMLDNVQPDDDVSSWSEPIFNGRVIAALAQAPDLAARSGGAYRARELAAELAVPE
jgi:NAD(P)-dependent dehydrogenase (short-subunit alcohol dehydrogenase family)